MKKILDGFAVVDLVIIALLGLISITWFRGDFIIKSGDSFFGLAPFNDLYRNSYIWDHIVGTGAPLNTFLLSLLPYRVYASLFQSLGFSLVAIQKIFYYASFVLSGILMYLLSYTLARKRIAGLVSGIFYMMNPFSLSVVWNNQQAFVFSYVALPLLVALFIRGLTYGKYFENALLISVFSVIFCLGSDISSLFEVFVAFLAILSFHTVANRGLTRILKSLHFAMMVVAFLVLLNLWWIMPVAYFVWETYATATIQYSSLELFVGASHFASLLNNFRLLGWYQIYVKWSPDPNYAWAILYSTTPFIILSILIPLLAYSSLLIGRKEKYVKFFAILSIISLFLMKGTNDPFGIVDMWMFEKLPFGAALRSSYTIFGPLLVLSYAYLIGIAISRISKHFGYSSKELNDTAIQQRVRGFPRIFMVCLIFLLLFGIYAFPFWNGDVIYPGGQYIPSARIRVPEYYTSAASWMNNQSDEFKILYLPPSYNGAVGYSWKYGYAGSDWLTEYYLLNRPIVDGRLWSASAAFQNQRKLIIALIQNASSFDIAKVFGLMNVKYVLVQGDWNTKTHNYVPGPEYFINVLDRQENLRLVKVFGKLYFYQNLEYMPFIYVSNNPVFVVGNFSAGSLNDALRLIDLKEYPFVVFSSDVSPEIHAVLDNFSHSSHYSKFEENFLVSVQRVNPTKYEVRVSASAPLFLIFGESYHKDWIARINGQIIPDRYHFMANGYANAWYINKTGTYTIILEFWPQKLFYIGSAMSITTFAMCIFYINKTKLQSILPVRRYLNKHHISFDVIPNSKSQT